MNNAVNSNEIPRLKASLGIRTIIPTKNSAEKAGLSDSDRPRVLRMSATLRRMLNEVEVAQNNLEDNIARA